MALQFVMLQPRLGWSEEPQPCKNEAPELVEQATAEAGVLANLTRRPNSLKVNIERLLTKGLGDRTKGEPASEACTVSCNASETPAVLLTIEPSVYLSEYSDKALCEKYLQTTTAAPIVFPGRTFASVSQLQDWFWELSTGKGEDGEALYRRCTGSCSPRYRTEVRPKESGYSVTTEVVCGPARDKDDNTYTLKLFRLKSCR
ncbi:MAG: hypothetical protein KDD69_07500 [Bdellovibrionales bacterium]|nr:hypothetical protein [Bdellovibrionales bacterium]